MDLTRELWQDSEPAVWRRAATDWRCLAAAAATDLDAVDRRSNPQVAKVVGYASGNKISNLAVEGRELRAAAAAGDPDAADRIARATALGRILTERQADRAS